MEFRLRFLTALGLVLLSADVALSELLGGAFKVCKRSDPDLNQCVVDSINGARDQLAKGIPELGLPPFTDLYVDYMQFEGGPEDIRFQGMAKNFSWIGFQDFKVLRAKINLAKSYMEIQTFQPKLIMDGYYVINGSLLTLRIRGEGQFKAEMLDVNTTHRILLEEVQREGVTFWKVKRYQWAFEMSNVTADIKNLYGGNERLTLYANQFINSFWKPIFEVYKEIFHDGYGEFFGRQVNKMFESVPAETLLPP